jgi:hypothetical protein
MLLDFLYIYIYIRYFGDQKVWHANGKQSAKYVKCVKQIKEILSSEMFKVNLLSIKGIESTLFRCILITSCIDRKPLPFIVSFVGSEPLLMDSESW